MRSAAKPWPPISSNSAINVENISVSISLGKNRPVQNPIPIILGIIIAKLAWMIFFFVEIAANTRREEGASRSRTMFVKNAKIDKAMSNVKAQISNKVQIPNFKYENI